MRWEELFADLEAQQEELERREREIDIAEHTRAERGQVGLAHRFVAAEGAAVRVRVEGVGWLDVTVRDVGTGWLLLDQGREGDGDRTGREREVLVALPAVTAVEGMPQHAVDPAATGRRMGMKHALRVISRDRAAVRVHDRGGDHLTGTIDRVLSDHLDVSRHADDVPRRASAVRGMVSVPYAALALVRRL